MQTSLASDDLPEFDAAADDGAAIMDTFRAPEIEGEGRAHDVIRAGDDPGEVQDENPASEPMDKTAFWVVFQAAFSVPMMLGSDFAPLAIQSDEKPAARAASDACYDLLSIYFPRALLPVGNTFGLILTAGPFLLAKAMLVRAILADRKAKRIAEAEAARRALYGQAKAAGQAEAAAPVANENRPPAKSPMAWMDQEQAA